MKNDGKTRDRYLCFSLGTEEYAIPLLKIKEVIGVPEITPVPFTPSYFKGIINIRGQVISIIDLREKLGIKPKNTAEVAVIICDLSPLCLGIIVDSINCVFLPDGNDVCKKPDIQSSENSDYITCVFNKNADLVIALNIEKALSIKDWAAISESADEPKVTS